MKVQLSSKVALILPLVEELIQSLYSYYFLISIVCCNYKSYELETKSQRGCIAL